VKRWALGYFICFHFATGIQRCASKDVIPLESAQCSKKIDDRPINMALSKKEKVMSSS
jgi:hypothetical protein